MTISSQTVCCRSRVRSYHCAAVLLLIGLLGAVAYNLVRWPRDRRHARELRRVRAQPRPAFNQPLPRVSVVVAAWNERTLIERHIESILALTYPNLEYILCAGGEDGTYDLACRYARPGLTILQQQPGDGVLRALARCVEAATGEILFFTDADTLISDDAFAGCVGPLISEAETAATGACEPLPEQRHLDFVRHRWAANTYRSLQAGKYVQGLSGFNFTVRADALRAVDGLAETLPVGFDFRVARRLLADGYRIRFAHASVVQTQFETTLAGFARQRSRWLNGIMLHAWETRAWDQVCVVGIFYAVGVAAVALPIASVFLGPSVLAMWVVGLSCAILNRVRYLWFLRCVADIDLPQATYAKAVFYVPRDLLVLGYAALDLCLRGRARTW